MTNETNRFKKQNKLAVIYSSNATRRIKESIKIILDQYDKTWSKDEGLVDAEKMTNVDHLIYTALFAARNDMSFVNDHNAGRVMI